MEFGLHLPGAGPSVTYRTLRGIAQAADESGFDSLWVSDHVVLPRTLTDRYPYSESGEFVVGADAPFLEPIATLCFVAGCTERVRVGTEVLVLPYRNPVVTAKQLASLDYMSGGRLIFGVGTGWMAQEFAALDVPFAHRGARTDEYIRLIKQLWTADDTSFSGRFYELENVGFYPKPLQQPHPPIWAGGHTEPAFKRCGFFCDGWIGASVTPASVAAQFARVKAYAAEAGRDPASLTLAAGAGIRPWEHSDREVGETIAAFRAAGVSHLVFGVRPQSVEQAREDMTRILAIGRAV